MSNESLLVILAVGLVAGWLAGQIMRGAGYGLFGDLIVGVLGAFIADWLAALGDLLGAGLVAVIDATIGALLLSSFCVSSRVGAAGAAAGDGGGACLGDSEHAGIADPLNRAKRERGSATRRLPLRGQFCAVD